MHYIFSLPILVFITIGCAAPFNNKELLLDGPPPQLKLSGQQQVNDRLVLSGEAFDQDLAEVVVFNGIGQKIEVSLSGTEWSAEFNLFNGPNHIYILARDKQGQEAWLETAVVFTSTVLETQKPTIRILNSSFANGLMKIELEATDNQQVSAVRCGNNTLSYGGAPVVSFAVQKGPHWICRLQVDPKQSNLLSFTAYDSSNNQNSIQQEFF